MTVATVPRVTCSLEIAGAVLTWPDHEWELTSRSFRNCGSAACGCQLPYVCDDLKCGNCGAFGFRAFPILATLTEIVTGSVDTHHLPA